MKETRASPYLQHLQRNALFYLQMLAMILLIIALIQPYWKTKGLAGEQLIFIVDTSASMTINSQDTNLFEKHKKEMLELVEQSSNKPITIIATGDQPTALVRKETNQEQIKKEITKLEVNFEHENMPKTLDFAQSFFQDKSTSVYIFTDKLDRQSLPLQYDHVSWDVRGQNADVTNISIQRFGATKTTNGISALIQLENQSSEEAVTMLTLSNEQRKLFSEEVNIPPNEKVTLTYENLIESTLLEASINDEDQYPIDNSMTVFMQDQLANVFVDSSMHSLIRNALQTLDIEVSSVPSEQIAKVEDPGIIVTNQFGLNDQLDKPTLYIGRNDESAIEANGVVETMDHALFSFADLSDIYVSSLYPPVEGYETIATVGEYPFIQISPSGDVLVLADIQMTDWPLHPSFPLFMWSVKEQLSVGTSYLGTFSPNERKSLSLGGTNEAWEIFSIDDDYDNTIENGGAFIAPKKPGLYVLRSNGEDKYFAVALSSQEKQIQKGTSYTLGDKSINTEKSVDKHSLVPYFLLILVLLFVIEWEVQRRRGFTS